MSAHGQPGSGPTAPQPRLLLYVAEGARADSRLLAPTHSAPQQHYQPTHKTYLRNPPSDIEEAQLIRETHNIRNCDSAKQLVPEYANAETFQSRVAPNFSESFQTRFGSIGVDSQVQPLIVQQNTYSENSVINSDKETNIIKTYMNYPCLDQNISYQSNANQNISVINPVSGRSVCDSEGQLFQTADGVVLAVVPTSLTHRTKQGDLVQTIIVPLGWKRIANVSTVVYVSPSGTALSTLSQVREYLQTAGTCKCGLPCPLRPEATFSFDPKVVSKPYQPPTGSELTKLCNHKRKLLATLSCRAQSPSQSPATPPPPNSDHMKVTGGVGTLKKKMKKPGYASTAAMPQVLMQRDQQRPQGDYSKMQELDSKRNTPPGLRMAGAVSTAVGNAPEKQSRVAHYLTVNSGWIQQDPEYKQCTNLNVGLPVLGANGQIIGVNTAFNKQVPLKNNTHQYEDQHESKSDQDLRPKEDEGQIFCGLNQPLTPEVMQKINEQQQLFIQQNQKQIEIAMKGYRAQLETNQNACQNQFAQQGQLVIQNGNVVKQNPAKTPPWQVKRTDSITSPSSRSQKSDNMDFDDCSTNISEDSTVSTASCNNSETLNQALCSRVPPLPQHYNVVGQQWPVTEAPKKKTQPKKVTKKKASPESKIYGANGMRIQNDSKRNFFDDMPSNNIPSFMDDPTGYLAQQTALLNNTLSRQVGLNAYDNQQDGNSFNLQGEKSRAKGDYQMTYKSGSAPKPSPSPNNTPDSSIVSDKSMDMPSSCCRGCNVDAAKSHFDNHPRRTYSKHNITQKRDESSASASREESVTSSTFLEPGEACPIQAGTVSTSNERLDSSQRGDTPVPPPVMNFISHHNINKNLMDVDNIGMVGVRAMPGYCPPPHLGGGPAQLVAHANYAQALVTTMASGFSVTRDTVTSVLAGRATTATTSVSNSRPERLPPAPPAPPPQAAYAIPNNHPDPFVHSVNLPTSYPLHIAGTTAQNMISKSPLEMVQNVLSSPTKSEGGSFPVLGRPASAGINAGQILISSTGQMMLSNRPMPPPPPPPKVSQQQILAPYVMQQSQSMESQILQHSNPLPHLVTGAVDSRQIDSKTMSPCLPPLNISPENLKKKSKKKKSHANITNVLQIAAPSNNIVLQSPQHGSHSQFSPRGFQLSPNNSLSPGAMLQALTIVPGKPGTPAHIVMNGQGGSNNFGSQSLIANASPSQSINLLQPVNLINNGSGVVPNFPAFQQFIVPNLGGVVMTADGTILQENGSGVPMQLQIQTVNGQNVLTPVQGGGVFASNGNGGGVLLRAQNQQGKIIQSQHSPGAQFLSTNSQVMMSSPNFNGQLSPLLASLSPPTVTFNTSPQQVRSSNVQGAEFMQANQLSHLMVPLSPKQVSISPVSSHRSNSTFVQNTTIVQQQTIMSNNSIQSGVASRLSFEPSMVVNSSQKQMLNQARGREMMLPSACQIENIRDIKNEMKMDSGDLERIMNEEGEARSVSTQTLKVAAATSPPDTTTHSPPARPPDTTTRDDALHAEAMVQCVSSSEQDMTDAQGHSPWNYEPLHNLHDSDAQGSMSNMHMLQQMRHNTVESTHPPYNHAIAQNHSHQDLSQIPNNYYDRGQMYKRKCEYEPAPYRHEKIMRTSYNVGNNKMMEYDYGSDKTNMMFSNSGPSSDGSGVQRVFDKHLGTDSDTKPDYQETRTIEEATHSELSSSENSQCFEIGDLIWGPVKGYVSWPGKLVRKGDEGKWHVKWFGDKPPGIVDGAKLFTLSEGLEAHHTARTKHRKSRKLNTHLENAIQQAMAELDKKSEDEASTSTEFTDEPSCTSCTDTPRRKKNKDKRPLKGKPSSTSPDNSRLRSAR